MPTAWSWHRPARTACGSWGTAAGRREWHELSTVPPLTAPTPAAQAAQGRPLIISAGQPSAARPDWYEDSPRAEAFLPLIASSQTNDLALTGHKNVIGVCCLSFPGPRDFRRRREQP